MTSLCGTSDIRSSNNMTSFFGFLFCCLWLLGLVFFVIDLIYLQSLVGAFLPAVFKKLTKRKLICLIFLLHHFCCLLFAGAVFLPGLVNKVACCASCLGFCVFGKSLFPFCMLDLTSSSHQLFISFAPRGHVLIRAYLSFVKGSSHSSHCVVSSSCSCLNSLNFFGCCLIASYHLKVTAILLWSFPSTFHRPACAHVCLNFVASLGVNE